MSTPSISASLHQLVWFVRIVEAGSFAEAARRSGATTSAMSKAISRLERSHGVRLLHRTTHSLSLTEEGDRLLTEGRLLLKELERVESSLADVGTQGATGRVRVATPISFARTCLMPELPKFLHSNPEIHIELSSGHDIMDMAAHGIDITIVPGSIGGLPGHVSRRLFTFPWITCATPEYLEMNGTPACPNDLAAHKHIGYRNQHTGQIDSWRFKHPATGETFRQAPRPQHIFDDGEAAWSLVRAGFGIGWAPSWLGLEDLRNGRVIEILKDWRCDEAPLHAVRLEKRLTPRRTEIVLDFLSSLPSAWQI